MSKSKQYWLDRMLDRDKAAKLSEDKILEELNRYYTDSYIAIEKELNNFYVKYATENGLSYNQARKILTPKDIREYSSKIGELKKIYEETKDMNVYLNMQEIGSRANVTRLQSLLDSIDIELIKSAHNTQISIEQHLSNMYKRSYKQALEDIGASNKAINSRAVKEALSYPWSGRNFSERIWGNNSKIFNTMQETITRGIIKGKSVPNVAKDIKRLSNQVFKKEKTFREMEKIHKYNAERLVRTETNHFMTKGHIEGYKASGVVKAVEICVHWDERTCPDCESMDREVIPLNEVSYGSNVPPFHPFCRCTLVPVVDNNEKTDYNYNRESDKIIKSREFIKSDAQLKKILEGKQGKHILGHNNYTEGRSYLTISLDEAQEFINKYAGTGEIRLNSNGEWDEKEIIKVDKNIGVDVNNKTGEESITNRFKVHYSKKGTHIVPMRKE